MRGWNDERDAGWTDGQMSRTVAWMDGWVELSMEEWVDGMGLDGMVGGGEGCMDERREGGLDCRLLDAWMIGCLDHMRRSLCLQREPPRPPMVSRPSCSLHSVVLILASGGMRVVWRMSLLSTNCGCSPWRTSIPATCSAPRGLAG